MMPTERQRYERYAAYCLMLDVQPLEFAGWRKESDRIAEFQGLDIYATNLRYRSPQTQFFGSL